MLGEGSLDSKFAVFLKSSFGSLPFHLIREKASALGFWPQEGRRSGRQRRRSDTKRDSQR